ncbi:MAG: exonuclease domain-containing protein, partial [Tritonibacter mobilis]|nr:exonuclease domain-containing protein [Tritonibacter mobilis]
LTHITQSMVDGAPPLADAIAQMNVWLNNIGDDFIWGSWGNYDLHHLTTQCAIDGANSALLKHDHLNLKKLWRRTTRQRKRTSLAAALDFHDIEFAGQPHRGIDDAQNIARILPFMDWSLEAEIITARETSMRM